MDLCTNCSCHNSKRMTKICTGSIVEKVTVKVNLDYFLLNPVFANIRLFNLILYSKHHFYTVYFLIVQTLIIILDQGIIILC